MSTRLAIVVLILAAAVQSFVIGATVILFGEVVRVAVAGSDDPSLIGPIAGLGAMLFLQRALEIVTEPVGQWASASIDIGFRLRAVDTLYRPSGIAHCETAEMRGKLAMIAGDLHGHTPGAALAAYIGLAGKSAVGVWCLLLIGRYAWWAAALAVVLVLVRRSWQQRAFGHVYRSWRLIGEPARRMEYWREFHTDVVAAKEIRVFGLPQWSLGKLREAALAKCAPVWAGRRRATRSSWGPFLVGIPAGALLLLPALYAGRETAGALGAAIAAGLTILRLSEPGSEGLAIEHVRPLRGAARELERAAETQQVAEAETAARLEINGYRAVRSGPVDQIALRLDHVDFHYPHHGKPVLHDICVDIPAGTTLAIVGANGAGKSTLTKLIGKLYEPNGGAILVNDLDLRVLEPAGWRRQIATMPQGFVRYDLTLRENVLMGAPELFDHPEALQASALGLDDLVARLPRGWDTPLGTRMPGAVDLSGGEWQRVALARITFAVMSGRRLVILDEPTAHLDAEAELAALDHLHAVTAGVTQLVVSHRMATVRHADQIAVIADGRIAELGTHSDLVAHGTLYAQMYTAQAERYLAGRT